MFGEIKFFVGLQFYQMKKDICITQSKSIKEILKTFGMEDSRLVGAHMLTSRKLSKSDDFVEVN